MKNWNIKAMNTLIKISAIITSGGKSTRFGKNKLLEKIGKYTVIETAISKFINLVDEIIIPCNDDTKEIILNSELYCNKIKFTPSGITRQKSVLNGILACSNPEIVLIHDGARPYIEKEIIQKTINLTYEKKAIVVGSFAIDTIKLVENGIIQKTIDRTKIFQAHTPQAFNYDLIKKIHLKYKNDDNFTDDASMAEKEGIKIYTIEDFNKNQKITYKKDLS